MKVRLDMASSVVRGTLIVSYALVAPSPVCFGQTNSSGAAAPPVPRPAQVSQEAPLREPPGISFQTNAHSQSGLSAAAHSGDRVETSRPPWSGGISWVAAANAYDFAPSRRQAAPSSGTSFDAKSAETALFQRIEREGVLQTRQSIREAQEKRHTEVLMDALSHHPESIIWGGSPNGPRMFGNASGVP
jgi:hypothetical protein